MNVNSGYGNWGHKSKSNGWWTPSDGSFGLNTIRFTVTGSQIRMLWLRVYYGDNSVMTISGSGTNGALTNGVYRYGDNDNSSDTKATATITSSKDKSTIYYTTDGSDPLTNSNRKTYSSAVSITNSTVVKAFATYTQGGDNGDKTVASAVGTLVFTRFYKRNISSYKYTTLVFPTALKVPSTCSWAAACTYNSSSAIVTIPNSGTTGRYNANSIIPANTPVLVYASSAGDKEFDWINEANGEAAADSPSSNNLEGNATGSAVMPTSNSSYTYFGLMAPTTAQKNRGKSFGFYQFNYAGTCGAIPAYRAYLKVLTTNVKSNAAKEGISFGFFDDDNTTTGISVIPETISGSDSGQQGASSARYNLSGQQVGPGYKGIVIVNGRKMIVK